MKTIELTKGYTALIDDDDFEEISKHKWHVNVRHTGQKYARTNLKLDDGKYKTVYMHRFIMNPKHGMVVDHINGNGLDCRKENMRVCTHGENITNQKKNGTGTSKYNGVWFERKKNKWVATCVVNGKQKKIRCRSEFEAANTRDRMAKNNYGEFAVLNFPEGE